MREWDDERPSQSADRRCHTCLSIASWAVAQELPLVFVEQSEGLVEMQIDDYLRKTEGFTITIDEYDCIPDDLFLRFENTFRDAPELSFLVDTLQSATDNDDVVTERVIKITSWYILNVTPGHWARAPVLEMINTFSQEFWAPPKIYLDDDGDIRFEWFINVPSEDAPVHLELVRDAIVRIGLNWEDELYPRLLALGLE